MNKIIIDNRTNLKDIDAVELALNVVKGGRCSNFGKEYCYLTVVSNWQGSGKDYRISSIQNKWSDRLVINNNE